jgi:hypothetical protein
MTQTTNDKPAVLVDVYGTRAPDAARFGKGVTDQSGVQQATDARRNAQPGECSKR